MINTRDFHRELLGCSNKGEMISIMMEFISARCGGFSDVPAEVWEKVTQYANKTADV